MFQPDVSRPTMIEIAINFKNGIAVRWDFPKRSPFTAESQRNPHYVRVRGDDLKARKMGTLTTFRSGLNILTAGLYFQSGHDLQ